MTHSEKLIVKKKYFQLVKFKMEKNINFTQLNENNYFMFFITKMLM